MSFRILATALVLGGPSVLAGCGGVAETGAPDAAIEAPVDAAVAIDAAPVCNTRLALIRNDGGPFDIFTMNEDGSDLTNITNSATFNDILPRWSPDGRRIVFLSNQNGSQGINIMNADGSGVQLVADGQQPQWSPDGSQILFSRSGMATSDIYVVDVDGTNEVRLTELGGTAPFWTPDGSKIVFESLRGGDSEIFSMNADGSAETNLTANSAPDTDPSVSADGSKIVYITANMRHVAVMNIDGTGVQPLFEGGSFESSPSFSPDSTKLVFKSGLDIMVSNADGSSPITIGQGNSPRWSPRGDAIVYQDETTSGVSIGDATVADSGLGLTLDGNSASIEWQPCVP